LENAFGYGQWTLQERILCLFHPLKAEGPHFEEVIPVAFLFSNIMAFIRVLAEIKKVLTGFGKFAQFARGDLMILGGGSVTVGEGEGTAFFCVEDVEKIFVADRSLRLGSSVKIDFGKNAIRSFGKSFPLQGRSEGESAQVLGLG